MAEAVLYVGDLARMRDFYQRCFGLTAKDSGSGYVGLESNTWLLTLVESVEARPTTSPPREKTAVPVKLAFEIADIDALRHEVESLGGQVRPPDSEWRFRDATRCDCVDPEGNIVQLIQATSAPNVGLGVRSGR